MPLDPVTLITVPPFEKNLSHSVGTDKSFKITVYGLDKVSPVDLTDWVAVSFVVHAYDDPNVVYITKTAGSGVTFSNRPAGEITVTIEDSDVDNILPNTFQWRLERTDSGSERVIGQGCYTVLAK